MTRRGGEVLPRLAWSALAVTVALVAADVAVATRAVPLFSETAVAVHGFPFVEAASVGCALMGALIVARYPRHPVGWLLIVVGLSTAISLVAEAYAYWVLEAGGPGPTALGGVGAWLAQLCGGQLVIGVLAWLFLLAPDGHLASPRWRYAAAVPTVGSALCLGAILTVDPTTFDLVAANDRFGPTRLVVLSIGFLLILIGMALAWISVLVRLRAATGDERQQLRPIALSAGLAAAGLVMLVTVQQVTGGVQTWLAGVPLFVAFLLMPILFAVAALRYRLYDLDVIIGQTVLVVAGTAFAALGYTALVVLAGRLLEGRAGGFWLSLVATAAVALAFQPLRRFAVRLADRAAYGTRAQPYEALAAFGRRLADAPDPDELLPAVAEAAARAVSAQGARAALAVPGGDPATGTWGWWPAEVEIPHPSFTVRAEGRDLGTIEVVLRRGRSLRPSDVRLLEALADQTGVAFRNTVLAGALAARVADLDRTTRDLAASRARLIEADDAARRTLEAAIARDVLPYLASLPTEIDAARAALAAGDDPHLEALIAGTNRALEALRELTRGVFPAQLARSGLDAALRGLVARAGMTAELTTGIDQHRYPARVEAAVYFCATEAVGSAGGPVAVHLAEVDGDLVLRVGGLDPAFDRRSATDRAEAAGGRLRVEGDVAVLTVPATPIASPIDSPVGAAPAVPAPGAVPGTG
ncbi:hypothetical protein E8D34_10400 [Nocardioides sp. GY 10113]|uniref:hypothetical protein n=1 Tax=Nocardioides sp. GY 10113 TaxID=2569761 RepID=UPI0010A82E70|nr:hypothetical protein [Nocardioides sp. GY 10113]TIC87517.1 hypothetical protein E8D34_10400 [Nocardioides sp. GY 10113]